MQQIDQIKLIRDEAMERLQSNLDYKILVTLSNLIADLEDVATGSHLDTGGITKLDVYTNDSEQTETDDPDLDETVIEEEVVATADADDRRESVDRAFEKISNDLQPENLDSVVEFREESNSDNSVIN